MTLEADVAIVDDVRLIGVEPIRQHARRARRERKDIVMPLKSVERLASAATITSVS